MKTIIVLLLFMIFTSCADNTGHNSIIFINNTDVPIDVSYSLDYPDLDLGSYDIHNKQEHQRRIMPNKASSNPLMFGDINASWEGRFQVLPVDTLIIQVFDSRIIDEYIWSKIRSDYMILQQYFLSLENLQSVDWRISYPPTPEMKDIKMWPPYEEVIKNAESLNP